MAFMGIFLINIIFFLLGICLLLFFTFLTFFIVFLILSKIDKTKKNRKVAKNVFGILTIIFFLPLLVVGSLVVNASKIKINYNGKNYIVKRSVIEDFKSDIVACDTKKLDKDLKKHPELINSKGFNGILPLGQAINSQNIECIDYFIKKDIDINKVSTDEKDGTLEYALNCNSSDGILEYLISQKKLDINKSSSTFPIAQKYIFRITEDKLITAKEIEIFKKLLENGLDLEQENSISQNTYEYIDNLKNEITDLDKLKHIISDYKNMSQD